jgi:peptidoglycan/LPS O-acetylase OafA/YrhL
VPGGSIGVSILFCLSGLLICRILIGLPELSPPNIARFIFRRFMRVWPMMAFQIILVLGLMMLLHPLDVANYQPLLPGLPTFTSSYGAWVGLSPAVLWTLRAEFWFYVLFAAAFYFTGLRRFSGLILVAIIMSWIAKFRLGLAGSLPFGFQPAVHTLVYLDQLMYGALCASIIETSPSWLRYLQHRALLWVPLIAIFLLSAIPFKEYDWIWYAQTSAAALCTAVMLLHHSANPVRGDFEPLATIGRISFSIHLMHAAVIDFISAHIVNAVFDAVVIFGAIIGICLVTYRNIEVPFVRLSKRIAPFQPSARSAHLKSDEVTDGVKSATVLVR